MPIVPLLLFAAYPVILTDQFDIACPMPPGWNEVVKHQPRYVIFGEQHGTQEAPAFVGDVVCGLAQRGERILLAIEHPVVNDHLLRAIWGYDSDRFAAALLQQAWPDGADGTASRSMFNMLVRLHRLKAGGAAIMVTAFNGMRDDAQARRFSSLAAQGPHEAAQAENIRTVAERGRYDRVIVLVGNFHARRSAIVDGQRTFDPMARRLARSGRTISLNLRSSGGTAWNCSTKPGVHFQIGKPVPVEAIECASHAYTGTPDLHRAPFIQLGAFPNERATPDYDGFFWVGRTSAATPQTRE